MNNWLMEDLMQDAYETQTLEYDMTEALWDKYFYELEGFYYRNRRTEKDWEELTHYEVEQVKRDYETDKELDEMLTDPERFYGTGGMR